MSTYVIVHGAWHTGEEFAATAAGAGIGPVDLEEETRQQGHCGSATRHRFPCEEDTTLGDERPLRQARLDAGERETRDGVAERVALVLLPE